MLETIVQQPAHRSGEVLYRSSSTLAIWVVVVVGCSNPQDDIPHPPVSDSRDKSPQVATDSATTSRPSHPDQRPEFLKIAEQLENSQNRYLGQQQLDVLRQQLKQPGLATAAMASLRQQLWWHELRLGHIDAATEQIETLLAMARARPNLPSDTMAGLLECRAITLLRQAEITNCVQQHNRDCCIFPLREGGIHQSKDAAVNARENLISQLEVRPGDLEAIWLLNLASMAIGDYPDGVPESYRIPPGAFRAEYDIQRFPDVAPSLGINTFNLCGGVIVDDFDANGFLDIITSTYDPRGPITYYRNLGTGQFEDASAVSRLDDQLGGLNCMGGDYDNDGDVDVLVLRGAWLFDDGQIRNSLLRNDADGTFVDVTREAGLAQPARPTQAAVWGDFDNDGNLDLFVGNESRASMNPSSGTGDYPSQLFRNNRDGTFTDIAQQSNVTNDRYAKGAAAGDYDNDGDLDLYVSNIGNNRLYQNNGDGTFTDVGPELGVDQPSGASFATWFFDYDNDGWLDLFVAAYECTLADIAADYLGQGHEGVAPRLYRNDRNGGFTDVTQQLGLDHPYLPMGANFGDLDYDGFLDLYLATGKPNYRALVPNIMLRNDRAKKFQDVTTSGGFGHLQKGHGVGFADIDNDGDQDIYHQLGGFYPGDRFHNALFRNPGHGHRFIVIQLVGHTTNRSAVGARLRVTVATPDGRQTFHRAVGCVSSFGGSPLRQEVGLGTAHSIEQIEVDWPTSRTTQVITGVPLDGMVKISEGAPGFETVPFEPLDLQ